MLTLLDRRKQVLQASIFSIVHLVNTLRARARGKDPTRAREGMTRNVGLQTIKAAIEKAVMSAVATP
jgi:hypothetical protein